MTKYSFLIDNFTWSYSRLKLYEDCPYAFLMRYILRESNEGNFFSQFGLFMHELLADFLDEKCNKYDCIARYVSEYNNKITTPPPKETMISSYYSEGFNYINSLEYPNETILGVEKKYDFDVDGKPFKGIVDAISSDEEGRLIITDHKSRKLRPRSGRSTPTVTDMEIDQYLRQLYLYAVPIKREFGQYPDFLRFNCFRTGTTIMEPFDMGRFEEVKRWAIDLINTIRNDGQWEARFEWFKCHNICDFKNSCEYTTYY